MNDWQYTFDPVSKAEWILQIEKDLKQKPLSTLSTEWWPGEDLSPLIHAEDIQGDPICLPDFMFTRAPLILEWMDTQGIPSKLLNARILDALRYGAEHLVLAVEDPSQVNTGEWLDSVYRDMIRIEIGVHFNPLESLESLFQRLPGDLSVRLNREVIPDNDYIGLLKKDFASAAILNRCRFVYTLPSSGAWVESAVGVFRQIKEDLSYWLESGYEANTFFSQCMLCLEADAFFFKHILQTRVIQLIYFNLLQHFGVTPDPNFGKQLEIHIHPKQLEPPSKFLIRASMSALATALCGSLSLCIHHDQALTDRQEFFRRINRNIHHLLHLESEMNKGRDPLAGAYTLDSYTRKWTTGIWDRLQL